MPVTPSAVAVITAPLPPSRTAQLDRAANSVTTTVAVYNSYKAYVADAGSSLTAGNFGKGIGMGLIAITWVIVDFLLAVTYAIYRLARR